MTELVPFSDEWVSVLVDVTSGRASSGGLGGDVTVKGMRKKATIRINDGRVLGAVDKESSTVLPFKAEQYAAWLAGDLNLSASYTLGDLRAVGPSGPLLAALEVFDDPTVRHALA